MDDYGSLIQAGQNLVPDVLGQLTKENALRAQTAQAQAETQAATAKLNRAQQFQQDIHSFDGSPTSVSHLIMKYPEFADHLKQGWDVQDKAKTDADLLNMGEIYSAASGGNWKLAKQLAHTRADAEKAAGFSDPAYEATLGVMDKAADGDPTQQKVVLNMLGMGIAAKTGPEHFATVYGGLNAADKGFTLDAGATRYDANGKVVVQSPYVKTADGGILERDGTGGGDPASPGAQTTAPGGPVVKRTHGYTPRERDGGDNPDNVVDNKIAALSSAVGVDPDTPMNPQQFAAFAQALPSTEGGAGTLSGKQNNPGAIKDGAFAKAQPGYAGAKNGYAVFSNPEAGTAAMQKLLTNRFYNKGQQSIRDIVEGRPAGTVTGGGSSAASPAAEGAPPGYHWLTPPKPKDAPSGYRYAADGKTLEAIPGGPADKGNSATTLTQYGISPDMNGPAVLQRLPANIASQVKALAEGRLPMPSSFALAKPYWQTMLQLTSQYDPTFDAASAPARKAAITAFTGNGKAAQTIGSVNRVANHLNLLWNESKNLAGPDVGWGPANSALATAGQSFEPAHARAYDTEVGFVAGELGKIAKNGVVTEGEINRIISNLGRKQAASTRESAIKAAVGIISGAVDPLKDQYNSAFTNDSTRPNIPWVSPQAQKIYHSIGGVDLSLTGKAADTNAPTTSGTRQPPPGATKTATGPNGQKAALVNGHWVVY